MLHPSLLFRWLAIGYIVGVGIWSVWRPPVFYCYGMIAIVTIIMGIRRRMKLPIIMMAVLGGTIGAVQINHFLNQRIANHVPGCCDREVIIGGVVDAEPAISIRYQTLFVKPNITDDNQQPARVQVRLPLGQVYNLGDTIEVKCKLNLPKPTDDFAYDKYLMLSNIRATCLATSAKIIGHEPSMTLLRMIFIAKRWTAERLQSALPEPQASLMAGLLIGSRSGLPDAVSNDFRSSGISHIVAISGYNITIIASMIFAATCRFVGRSRSFWLVVGVLTLFTIMTGAQASVIRATIMGIMALTAKQIGRAGTVSGLWLLAGTAMIAVNPMVLIFDAGFQLSFLATAGLIWLSPMIGQKLNWVPEYFGVRDSLASTLSATALTLPIMLCNFKQLSIIAPIANMLILPIIPPIMAMGAILIGLAAVSVTLSHIVGWFAWLGLSYILGVTHWLGNIPYASLVINRTTMICLMVGYVSVGLCLLVRRHKRKTK